MSSLYILDWRETAHGQRPTGQEVKQWLMTHGITATGIKVYTNGDVQLEADQDPSALWPSFAPMPLTIEDKLSGYVADLLAARTEVLAISEHARTPQDRLLLALTGLVLYGYGVKV
jgi:hypothetical protein